MTRRFFPAIGGCLFALSTLSATTSLKATQREVKMLPAEAAADEDRLSPGRFQLLVMDFADEYMAAVNDALDQYVASETDPARRVAAQYWRVHYTSAAMSIAAARDPRTNLLDMVVFISAGKWALNNYWIPKVLGKKAQPLAGIYQEMDQKIWAIADGVLTSRQQADLQQLIRNWESANPRMHEVANVRLRNLDGVHLHDFDDGHASWGVLASVQKFMKRIDKSLLYGERLMFLLDHTPQILAQQSDLTISQVGDAFPLAAVRPEMIEEAVKAFPSTLQAGLDRNEGSLSTLLPQINLTLTNANALAQSMNQSLQTVNGMAAGTKSSNLLAADPNALSNLAKEANQGLSHLDSSISGLNQLLAKDTNGGGKAEALSRQINAQSNQLMDAAFHRILLLLAAFFAAVVLILLLVKGMFFRKPAKSIDTES